MTTFYKWLQSNHISGAWWEPQKGKVITSKARVSGVMGFSLLAWLNATPTMFKKWNTDQTAQTISFAHHPTHQPLLNYHSLLYLFIVTAMHAKYNMHSDFLPRLLLQHPLSLHPPPARRAGSSPAWKQTPSNHPSCAPSSLETHQCSFIITVNPRTHH